MNSRLLCIAAFAVGSSLVIAACGGSSGSASAAGSTTTTVAGAAGRLGAFRDCLQKQGVTLPAGFGDRGGAGGPRGGSGGPGGPPGGFAAGGGKFQKAFQARRASLPAGGFGGGRVRDPQALQAYMSCLRDHGVKVPALTAPSTPTSTPAAGPGGFGRGPSALRAVRDPKFAAANTVCRPLLPTFGGSTTTTTTAS